MIINVPDDYSSIQEAIYAAENGDEVVIAPGEYREAPINFQGKAITVRSTDPDNSDIVAATIIRGVAGYPVFNIIMNEGPSSILSGLHITGGDYRHGGGISCFDTSPTITNNIVTGNKAVWGAGICCGKSIEAMSRPTPRIVNNTITGNIVTQSGGGIFCRDTSAVIEDNTIIDNEAAFYGGGISSRGENIISRNKILNNRSEHGAGIEVGESDTLVNNLICKNSSVHQGTCSITMGGGIYCHGEPAIINNTISHNSADLGGGIHCCSSECTIKNCIIAFAIGGGGIYLRAGNPDPAISYCDVFENQGGNYINIQDLTGLRGNILEDPRFANVDNNDYHLSSQTGRWDPLVEAWVKDVIHSSCIDAGDPSSDYSREPMPDGGWINMGAYGNTNEASMSASSLRRFLRFFRRFWVVFVNLMWRMWHRFIHI
jgi:parallel beta-helix repeat protein